jgi:hypothetical protein
MKLSVSVPDALWESSRAKRPDLNPSRLIQEALEGWQQQRSKSPFPLNRPADAEVLFTKRRDRLAAVAREEFESGYRAALEAAEVFDWWALESLADDHFDVPRWAQGWADSAVQADLGQIPGAAAPDAKLIRALIKALGNLVSPFGDDEFGPSAPYLRGFAQAMRDLWHESFEGWTKESDTASNKGSESGSEKPEISGETRAKGGDTDGT